MSRFIKLTTLDRRMAQPIRLFSKTRVLIGTMQHDPRGARHHCELPEETFLKHAEDIARLALIPGNGVYVSGIRDESVVPVEKLTPEVPSEKTAMGQQVAELAKTHHNTLRRMAAAESIDISGCKGVEQIAQAIVAGRAKQLQTA